MANPALNFFPQGRGQDYGQLPGFTILDKFRPLPGFSVGKDYGPNPGFSIGKDYGPNPGFTPAPQENPQVGFTPAQQSPMFNAAGFPPAEPQLPQNTGDPFLDLVFQQIGQLLPIVKKLPLKGVNDPSLLHAGAVMGMLNNPINHDPVDVLNFLEYAHQNGHISVYSPQVGSKGGESMESFGTGTGR